MLALDFKICSAFEDNMEADLISFSPVRPSLFIPFFFSAFLLLWLTVERFRFFVRENILLCQLCITYICQFWYTIALLGPPSGQNAAVRSQGRPGEPAAFWPKGGAWSRGPPQFLLSMPRPQAQLIRAAIWPKV